MKLTLLLIPLILLSSCTIDWNDEKDKKIAELEKQNIELKTKDDDEIFRKNIECSNKDLWDTKDLSGIQVFYSSKYKSCILVATIEDEKQSEKETSWVIYDILTQEFILMFSYQNNKITSLTNYNSWSLTTMSINEGKCIFNKKVNELKQRNKEDEKNYFEDTENCN